MKNLTISTSICLSIALSLLGASQVNAQVMEVEWLELAGRPGHQGYWQNDDGQPIQDEIVIRATAAGSPQSVTVKVHRPGNPNDLLMDKNP